MPFSSESNHGKWRRELTYLATKGFQRLHLIWPSQQPGGSVVQTLLFLSPAEHAEGKEADWLALSYPSSSRLGLGLEVRTQALSPGFV